MVKFLFISYEKVNENNILCDLVFNFSLSPIIPLLKYFSI